MSKRPINETHIDEPMSEDKDEEMNDADDEGFHAYSTLFNGMPDSDRSTCIRCLVRVRELAVQENGENWNALSLEQKEEKWCSCFFAGDDIIANLGVDLGYFYSHLKARINAELPAFLKIVESKVEASRQNIRVRDTEFAILSTPRIAVGNEMVTLRQHIDELFRWYTEHKKRDHFAAPYKPIVQSSGTGKTKLLADLTSDEEILKNHAVIFISCLPKDERRRRQGRTTNASRDVYNSYLNFANQPTSYLQSELNVILGNESCAGERNKVILLFDEAQELSRDGATHLHSLRRFLRRKREKQCVAFIAGTNQSLANCYPSYEQHRRSSREGEDESLYYASGRNLYPPIFALFTMGLFAARIRFEDNLPEFYRAIPFGRPLFARLLFAEAPTKQEKFEYPVKATSNLSDDEQFIIATRMLLGCRKFLDSPNLLPVASIWGTRVQLGSVYTSVVEELVAKGYAHLTSFRHIQTGANVPTATVGFTFMPDPVCARLAMCLMQGNWNLSSTEIRDTIGGASKIRWTSKLKELFSSGLFRPSRGDLCELLSAAYLLFCGDVLRHRLDDTFMTFSIPLSSWVSHLENPLADKMQMRASDVRVNFIQFCRNDLRLGLKDVCEQAFLRYIYNSCCAVYADEGCPLYDAYASIRYLDEEKDPMASYIPLFISITTREAYSDGDAKKNIRGIEEKLRGSGQHRALVMVVILDRGSTDESGGDDFDVSSDNKHTQGIDTRSSSQEPLPKRPRKSSKPSASPKVSYNSWDFPIDDCRTSIVSRIIVIPSDDPFGVTDVVRGVTRAGDLTRVYASHPFAGTVDSQRLVGRRKEGQGTKTAAVLTEKSESKDMLQDFWDSRHCALSSYE